MSLHLALLIVISVLSSVLGLLIYFKDRKKSPNRVFVFLVFSIVVWIITNYLCDSSFGAHYALFWNKAAVSAGILIGLSLFYFSLFFPRKFTKISFSWSYLFLFTSVIFIILTLFTNLIVKDIEFLEWGTNIIQGPAFLLFVIWASILVITPVVILILQYKDSQGIEKTQMKYVFWGLSLYLFFGFTMGVVLPAITGTNELARFGPYSMIFFVSLTAYAILKHHLLAIRVITTEALVAAIVLVLFIQTLLSKTLLEGLIRGTFLILMIYFGYLLIKSVINEIERRKEVEILAEKLTVVNNNLLTLQHINNKMVSTLELQRVAQEIVESLSTELSWRGGFVSLVDEKKETLNIAAISKKVLAKISPYLTRQIADYHLHLDKGESVLQACIKKIEIEYSDDFYKVIKGALKKQIAQKIQKVLKIKTFGCAPVVYRGKVIGAIVIGFDKKLAGITQEERKMISSIADQAAIAIENAKLYEEIEAANAKLKELDKLKNEFLSIASHQVRTPLSIIKGYISLLRTKKAGELSAQQERFMKNIQEANEQLINIINDFLNLSRIEQKRMKLEISKSDIKKIINEVMERLNHEAELKKIKLDFSSPKDDLPKINIDEPKIMEVITNLIDNAIKYSPENSKVEVRVKKKDNFLDISVKDQGIGIPEDFKDKLFQKFSRAHNAIQAQPSGNGIGLFVVKKIIDAHRGQIIVKTKEDKGTVFTVELNYKSGLKPGEEVDANKLEKEGIIRYDEYKSEKPEIRNQNDEKMFK